MIIFWFILSMEQKKKLVYSQFEKLIQFTIVCFRATLKSTLRNLFCSSTYNISHYFCLVTVVQLYHASCITVFIWLWWCNYTMQPASMPFALAKFLHYPGVIVSTVCPVSLTKFNHTFYYVSVFDIVKSF